MTAPDTICIDLFSGGRGWDVGAAMVDPELAARVVGVEWDDAACSTSVAAGFTTVQADVAALDPLAFLELSLAGQACEGVIASPPCTLFSSAGKGTGRRVMRLLADAIGRVLAGDDCRQEVRDAVYPVALAQRVAENEARGARWRRKFLTDFRDEHDREPNEGEQRRIDEAADRKQWTPERVDAAARSDALTCSLVLEPARWLHALLPLGDLRWVALEQVPSVLPLWEALAHALRKRGWSVECGLLDAADYGVPQNRVRAILVARACGGAALPGATHCRGGDPGDGLFGTGLLAWVSMAEALGWDGSDTVALQRGAGLLDRHGERPARPASEPAPTIRAGTGGGCGTNLLRQPARTACGRLLHTNRDQRPDGSRQVIDPATRPAPALTAKSGGQWALRVDARANATERAVDEPAPTLLSSMDNGDARWVLRNGSQANAAERALDEPAGTLLFGQRCNDVPWVLRTDNFTGTGYDGETRRKYERAVDEPAPTLSTRSDLWQLRPVPTIVTTPPAAATAASSVASLPPDGGMNVGEGNWPHERPATTVTGDARLGEPGHRDRAGGEPQFRPDAIRITVEEAAILQSFPPGYPWQGTKSKQFEQVGNAIPPLFAAHVLAAATGRRLDLAGEALNALVAQGRVVQRGDRYVRGAS
jgi:DNA (cytosine-5)-methyltransferase 1